MLNENSNKHSPLKSKASKTNPLEIRLIKFAADVVDFTQRSSKEYWGLSLLKQLVRSGTSPALNYGEARNAESRRDFVHKMSICLKELRETFICLRIIEQSKSLNLDVAPIKGECDQLIAIFTSSILTTKNKSGKNNLQS